MTVTDRLVRIVPSAVTEPVAAELVRRAEEELAARYQVPSIGTLRPGELDPAAGGRFAVAWVGDEPAGCGGIRRLRPDVAELKRLFVTGEARRRGVARSLLRYLHDAARMAGYRQIWLETGTEQPEAVALYEVSGYFPIAPFEPHASRATVTDPCMRQHDTRSLFFGIDLHSNGPA